jgi:hypothetical protein
VTHPHSADRPGRGQRPRWPCPDHAGHPGTRPGSQATRRR